MFHSSLTATINRLQSGQPDYPEEASAAGGAKNRTGKHKASQVRIRRRRMTIKMVTRNQKEGSLFIERQQEIDKERILVPSIRVTSIVIIVLINLLLVTQGGATGVDGHQASLPTVIVRGFLNYRTTVDGTVLLFTPDAGGSASGQSTQAIAPTSLGISSSSTLVSPARLSSERIEPSSVLPGELASTTFSMQPIASSGVDASQPDQARAGADTNWHHISTPPLTPAIQTAVEPAVGLQEVATSSVPTAKIVETLAVVASPQADIATEERPRLISVGESDQRQQTKPTVQSEDVGSSPAPVATTSPTPARASRPKRPSLGFTGQGVRGASLASRGPASESANTINGIRRPGLSTTTTTPSPTSSGLSPQLQQAGGSGSAAFHTRLTNASAKLRNKFRRPSFNNNSTGIAAPATSNQANLHPDAVSLDMAELSSTNADASVGNKPMLATTNNQLSLSPANEQLSPLQARLGDIFNPGASLGTSPVVGSDEVLVAASSSTSNHDKELQGKQVGGFQPDEASVSTIEAEIQPELGAEGSPTKPISRSGEQAPQVLPSGGLSGSLDANMPISLDGFFSDQAAPTGSGSQEHLGTSEQASEFKPRHQAKKNNNDKLNGWLDQHHNKFVPRPPAGDHAGRLSSQLAANPNLAPSFTSNIPSTLSQQIKPTPASSLTGESASGQLKPAVGAEEATNSSAPEQATSDEPIQLQTVTRTYSTVMTTFKTRLVPLQVKSTTAIHTITENYVITKVLTAYQTMPIGEFILPESSTHSPFELFENPPVIPKESPDTTNHQSIPSAPGPAIQPEQPISLDTSAQPKAGNDWLHDFTNPDSSNQQQQQQQQTNNLAALLEQQAQEVNMAGFPLVGEPLDGLASSLDPSALFADGAINIPDLNNPLVLAAAIQNPQLAAVILAAQQLQLKQRQQNKQTNNQQQLQPQHVQLQPSYSTSFNTVIKPSTYTVRDTMYTTRLVSFKDGRTVRTRTVSEPGQIIEQTLTTMATEVTPITITIRPTGVFGAQVATAAPQQQQNSQTTINNALIATQLANLLSRRQQQANANFLNPTGSSSNLAALQQLLGNQQRQQQAKQFQPNFQQLLRSMQANQPANSQPSSLPGSSGNSATSNRDKPVGSSATGGGAGEQQATNGAPENQLKEATSVSAASPTPPLPAVPLQPITTTLTNLQVKTYTVHNAFKTIFRTITSTQLLTSTIFPAGLRSSQLMG